jgi:hypothetical protein
MRALRSCRLAAGALLLGAAIGLTGAQATEDASRSPCNAPCHDLTGLGGGGAPAPQAVDSAGFVLASSDAPQEPQDGPDSGGENSGAAASQAGAGEQIGSPVQIHEAISPTEKPARAPTRRSSALRHHPAAKAAARTHGARTFEATIRGVVVEKRTSAPSESAMPAPAAPAYRQPAVAVAPAPVARPLNQRNQLSRAPAVDAPPPPVVNAFPSQIPPIHAEALSPPTLPSQPPAPAVREAAPGRPAPLTPPPLPASVAPPGVHIPDPADTALAGVPPRAPEPPPVATHTVPVLDTPEALAAYLSLEAEMLRTTESDAAFAACVEEQVPRFVTIKGRPPIGNYPEPSTLASQVYEACRNASPLASWDETSHAYMTVAQFRARMADFNADGAAIVASVLRSQVAFRLASEKHLFRCIDQGFLARVDSSSERPFVFRVLMTSIADHAVESDPVVKLILSSVRAYCADEQFDVSQKRS